LELEANGGKKRCMREAWTIPRGTDREGKREIHREEAESSEEGSFFWENAKECAKG
jgi:hypothetical protein